MNLPNKGLNALLISMASFIYLSSLVSNSFCLEFKILPPPLQFQLNYSVAETLQSLSVVSPFRPFTHRGNWREASGEFLGYMNDGTLIY